VATFDLSNSDHVTHPETEPKCCFNITDSKEEGEENKQDVTTEPVWLGDLIRDGFYDKLVIIGFPFDKGAKLAGNRKGADYGPDSFRRFLPTIGSVRNPEY